MESINEAGVLQKAEDAQSMAHIRIFQVEYFTIPYTSTFIRLSHLYQELYVRCVVIKNDKGMRQVGRWLIYMRVWVGGQGVCIML